MLRRLRSGAWWALLFAGIAGLALSSGGAARESGAGSHVNLIVIDGGINPAVNDYIRESIQRAHAGNARALIIQLDTPGGLLSSTRSIVKEMLSAPLPIIVYVAPSGAGAGSAGVFITMAANIAAMAPGTNIGAAHPVAGSGQEVKGVMGEKIENFTASFSETIAQRRGRNTEFAIQAVRRSISITDQEALDKRVIDLDRAGRERPAQAGQRARGGRGRRQAHPRLQRRVRPALRDGAQTEDPQHPGASQRRLPADDGGHPGALHGVLEPRVALPGHRRRHRAVAGAGVLPGPAHQLRRAVAHRPRALPAGGRGVPAELRAARHQRGGRSGSGLAVAVRRGRDRTCRWIRPSSWRRWGP